MNGYSLHFDIASYAVRSSCIQSDDDLVQFAKGAIELNGHVKAPKPKKIPMMAARRLCVGTRFAVDVALELLEDSEIDACVFSSRHGELERNNNILNALALGEDVSPTDFTMSVHNSAVANTVITAKRQIATSSVSAGFDTFVCGIIEAYSILETGARKVLVVDFDGNIPDSYQHFVPKDVKDIPYAVALVLTKGNSFSLNVSSCIDVQSQRTGYNFNEYLEHKSVCAHQCVYPSGIAAIDFACNLSLENPQIEIAGERNDFIFRCSY